MQFLTQVAFIRMESRIDGALLLFEKASSIAHTGPTYLNYGMALEASVFGLGRDESSFDAPPSWPAVLDTALEQYRAALMSQPAYVCGSMCPCAVLCPWLLFHYICLNYIA